MVVGGGGGGVKSFSCKTQPVRLRLGWGFDNSKYISFRKCRGLRIILGKSLSQEKTHRGKVYHDYVKY